MSNMIKTIKYNKVSGGRFQRMLLLSLLTTTIATPSLFQLGLQVKSQYTETFVISRSKKNIFAIYKTSKVK